MRFNLQSGVNLATTTLHMARNAMMRKSASGASARAIAIDMRKG